MTAASDEGSTAAVDVAVIGAGFTGLVAASELVEAGLSVTVLEARDRPGGRVDAGDLAAGLRYDLGGTFVSEGQSELLALADRYGNQPASVPTDGELVVHADSSGRRLVPADEFSAETRELVREIEAMAEQVPLEEPWESPNAGANDETTLAAWLHANASPPSALEIWKYVEAFMGQPSAFSMLHLLFYSRSNGGLGTFLGLGEVHDELFFPDSAHSIAERIATELEGLIAFDSAVSSITDEGSTVAIRSSSGVTRARCCIVALSPSLHTRLHFDPPLPEDRDQLSRRMALMSLTRLVALYPEPFWRNDNLTGRGFGPSVETLDTSPPDGEAGVLQAYTWSYMPGGSGAGLDDWCERTIATCVELFGEDARHPKALLVRSWGDEVHSRGCVPAMTPGTWTSFGHVLRRPHGRIWFASTETAPVWCGQMEGAARSGRRVAEDVMVEAL